jgi:peptidoglycan endopeptidase LytF
MTKRDTIIIAVLINMGVLLILCVGALKPNLSPEVSSKKLAQAEEVIKKKGQTKAEALDPVDSILSEYIDTEKTALTTVLPKIEIPMSREEIMAPAPAEVKTVLGEASLPKEKYKEVTVQAGDVLEKIARNHGTTVDEIMRTNHLQSSRLYVGQVLLVSSSKGCLKGETVSLESEEPKYYTVKAGDNPSTIASKNGIRLGDLLRLNHLDEDKAKRLKPGDRLRIR